ncbi:MAG: NADH-quinone oxidoreductase subunit N [Chloroflexi bacterium]|nr:NADH-quinone oxidoreductase subunit N [Chloroflexota bacterium]
MNLTDLTYLLPELILLLAATLVFVLDMVGPKGKAKGWLPYVAIGGLAAAALGVIPGIGAQPHVVASMLAADPFAVFFKLLAILAVAIVILTAVPYLNGDTGTGDHKGSPLQARTPYRGEFYALLLVVGAAICLVTSATNLVMIYLGMEFLSITSYILAGFLRHDKKSGEAALKYFLYGATASAVMLYGMSLLYGATGTTDLAGIAAAFAGKAQVGAGLVIPVSNAATSARPASTSALGVPALILLLTGFGFKASLAPFHQWAPDTYEGAPTPVTAFLSTASKAAGFAILMRVFLVALAPLQAQWVALLIAVSVLTMTVGNLTALRQTNVKRLLAYSSIAQAGYMLIGVAAVWGTGARAGASPAPTFTGINGVLIYLFAYLFTNVGAFAVVTAVETATGKVELKDYAGLIRRAPWLAGLLVVFLLSLAGIPPTGGFVGKFFVFGAAVQRQMWGLLAIAAVNSVVAAFYYLNIVRYMFFTPAEADAEPIGVAWPLRVSLGITAVLTLLLGLAPGLLIAWATKSVQLFALR